MQKLFKEQKVTLYRVHKDLNIDLNKLCRYAKGQCKIKNMPITLACQLANYFGMSVDSLYNKMVAYENSNKTQI